ncbi:putative cation-transporting ATPase [Erysiphe neolycopersici]|uniref:Cation-transporting ATPase n=1 Tax=Erysiphe neolycopersici TaxID=212602 RepID=A0A420I0W6_9PEZI|nr:putative cation-transporting ATPase [Erysiphe neolycopersici]
MDRSCAIPIDGQRSRNSKCSVPLDTKHALLQRRGSNLSTLSIVDTVQMAHEEIFSGPIAESVPMSLASFTQCKRRADSNTNFSIYRADNEFRSLSDENAIADDESEIMADEDLIDIESGERSYYRTSTEITNQAYLLRRNSTKTNTSYKSNENRIGQKISIPVEDLTIAIVGFRTSYLGYTLYIIASIISFGAIYLALRWIPRWKVYLIGKKSPLRNCTWVVIENQWGELKVQNVNIKNYGHSISTVFGRIEKYDIDHFEDEDPIMNYIRILDYRYIRLLYHPLKDKFVLSSNWKDPRWIDVTSIRAGIDGDEKDNRGLIFGKNCIDIEQKNLLQLLTDEVLHPFYIFQVASLVLWCLDDYFYYAVCIFTISLVSIVTTLIETRTTMERLHHISRFECDIRVLRNSFWRYVASSELVPGDVYEVTDPALKQLPCDSLLLTGDCIVNESMLTGESVPISKTPITQEALQSLDLGATSIAPGIAKHFLFGGTKIIRAKRPLEDSNGDAVGLSMVVRTGFSTTKGALVRSMLFPKPSGFKFYRDSFRYILVMAGIAMIGSIASLINFMHLQLEWHLIIVRALDLITIVVPPALPATLNIGINFALSRLKGKQIFCISPQRVNVGGKLDIVCFDKTGTLTEDGLDVLGIHIVQSPENRFTGLLTNVSSLFSNINPSTGLATEYDTCHAALHTMATCHSLHIIDGKLAGDPLDVKMFEFTGWDFEEGEQKGRFVDDYDQGSLAPSIARPPASRRDTLNDNDSSLNNQTEIGILKSFEFATHLRRASVITRKFGSQGCDICVKGAPECMRDICNPASLPPDFDEVLNYYTHRGFRVIALAQKHIKKLSWVKIQKMYRNEAESELDFIGFIIFENKLKPNTAMVLEELTRAAIRKLMCTGDNILTAISVAKECNLISPMSSCYVPRFIEGNFQDSKARLRWESIDDPSLILDENTLIPLRTQTETNSLISQDLQKPEGYSIAISGDAFRWIVDFAPINVLHKVLVHGQVFARMSPDEKNELVEKLQSIDYCCGFCGDGANDCGALKAADVGISLSEAEASIAAPFTSRIFDITCVPEVIREGRAALVTSFSCFKYMSLYSAIQFTSVSFLYEYASNLGDFQYLFIDLILILPIAIFMGWTKSYPILNRKRPTANLVSAKVLTPLFGQIIICILCQSIGYFLVRKQSWYIPPHLNKESSNIKNSENTVLFLISCFEYIFSGVVLCVGPPFRQPCATRDNHLYNAVSNNLLNTLSLENTFTAYGVDGNELEFQDLYTLTGSWLFYDSLAHGKLFMESHWEVFH